jgi:hypothetical protein
MASERVGRLRRGLAVNNSVSLGVFLAVAADDRTPFAVVELAGRERVRKIAGCLRSVSRRWTGSRWRTS